MLTSLITSPGNEAPQVSIEALHGSPSEEPQPNDARVSAYRGSFRDGSSVLRHQWSEILPRVDLGPSSRHLFTIGNLNVSPVNYVKLNMYPDGGIVSSLLSLFLCLSSINTPRLAFGYMGMYLPFIHRTNRNCLTWHMSLLVDAWNTPRINISGSAAISSSLEEVKIWVEDGKQRGVVKRNIEIGSSSSCKFSATLFRLGTYAKAQRGTWCPGTRRD